MEAAESAVHPGGDGRHDGGCCALRDDFPRLKGTPCGLVTRRWRCHAGARGTGCLASHGTLSAASSAVRSSSRMTA